MKILSSKQMHEADVYTTEHELISSIDLMERAASRFFEYISETYPQRTSFCIFCGKGNNGGDGLAIARMLANQGKEVFVLPNNIYYENAIGGLKLLEDGGNVLLGSESVIDSVSRSLMYKRMGMGCPGEVVFEENDKNEFDDKVDIGALRELAKVRPDVLTDDNWKMIMTDALSLKPLCADELCKVTMLPFYKVSSLLTDLELNGTVCQEKGKYSLTFV